MHRLLAGTLAALLIALAALSAAPPADVAREVAALIQKLGSEDADQQKSASARLQQIGKPALAAVRQAQKHTDPDIQLRAMLLTRLIEKQLTTITRDMVFKGHTNQVRALDVSHDGTLAVSGGYNKEAIVWDLKTGEILRRLDGINTNVFGVSFSSDGRQVLTALQSGQLTLHDTFTGKKLRTYDGKAKGVYDVSFLPDGKRAMMINYAPEVRLIDVQAMKELKTFIGHGSGQVSLATSRDGKYALTGGLHTNRRAVLWEVESGKRLFRFGDHGDAVAGCAFSFDSQYCATGCSDKRVRVWSVESGDPFITLMGNDRVGSVAFSPDGKTLAAGEDKGGITLWDFQTAKVIRVLTGHTGAVSKLRFTHDGQALVSASRDRTVRVWKLPR